MATFDLNTNVKDWYVVAFPEDDLAEEELNETITFMDVLVCLIEFEEVYDLIGIDDSIIRERIFQILCGFLKVDYDVIYNLWLESVRRKRLSN